MCVSPPVPTPTLDLSVPSGPLYEGTSQTLACSVTLPDTVDTDVTVDVQWTPAASSDRVMISAVSSMRPPFISTLTLSPLSMSDAGQYSCGASADSSSQYITASSQGHSQVEPLTVTGMWPSYRFRSTSLRDDGVYCLLHSALPAPVVTISFSGDSTAGQGYSLQCSASVVAGLVVLPDLKIVFPNSTEISVMDSSSLDYMFSPLRTSDGGQYTCTATVNIPRAGIMGLQNSAVKTLVVVGKQCHLLVHVDYIHMYVQLWNMQIHMQKYLFVHVCLSVAAYPVEVFEVTMSSETSLTFSWSPPSVAAQLTTGYMLTCMPLLKGISTPKSTMLGPRDTTATVTGLDSGVTYNCSIITISHEGSSQPRTLTPSTTESGKLIS